MTSGTGRTLWRAGTTSTSRICSASRKATTPVTVWMRQAVNDVYQKWLPLPADWTPEQTERHLVAETARLDRMAADLSDQLASTAIEQWSSRHGAHPDFSTTVRLRQSALQNARETIVRQELYDLIEQEEPEETVPVDPPLHQPVPASQVPWNLRWNDARYRTDPGDQIDALAEMVWPDPDFSVMFRIKAAYLLIALIEDQLPVPDGPQHPLAAELAPLVYADLVADGYPEQ
ncbi:hypothetical protein FEG63_21075 [Mycolicibacterium sphagni]|uniref:DUF2742 domain-containing protein n=1 Tax=Mycolicibacterium sphagni TaxID=1786 RepID=A0ABX2K2T6_9MYCO|nr:hypothetical protein [Mycolicibacterium sphagni]NTY62042.1 hypothetical protein [Mycolicibacterium sphagni]